MREVLFAALVLACPLMMIWMMRGHSHGHGHGHGASDPERHDGHEQASTEELRRQRAELDREIAQREQFEPDEQYGRDAGTSRSG
jgi:hypothetical protein